MFSQVILTMTALPFQILSPFRSLFYRKTETHTVGNHCGGIFFSPSKMERIFALPGPMPLCGSLTTNPWAIWLALTNVTLASEGQVKAWKLLVYWNLPLSLFLQPWNHHIKEPEDEKLGAKSSPADESIPGHVSKAMLDHLTPRHEWGQQKPNEPPWSQNHGKYVCLSCWVLR